MKILYIKAAHSASDLLNVLRSMGHEVDTLDHLEFDIVPSDEQAYKQVEYMIVQNNYDFAISYLFFAEISDICQRNHLKYIGWVYDSPLMSLYDQRVCNSNNYIFIFDKKEYEHVKAKMDIEHIYYLPMAANVERCNALSVSEEDIRKFSCNVSFVGNLYENNAFNQVAPYMEEDMLAPIKEKLLKEICNWHHPKEWYYVSNDILEFIIKYTAFEKEQSGAMDPALFLGIAFFVRKLAELDRITVLNSIAECIPVDLFTNSQSELLSDKVRVHPSVNYETDANKVFHLSKINLNITLPSIESGLPQRIYDVMASGGFLLTNYQPELEDYFEIGKDLEVFHDVNELLEKVVYYLTHEQERIQIAINGYQKVTQFHNYESRLEQIIAIVGV